MNDGVESGSATTEWKSLIATVVMPLLNGLVSHFIGKDAALSETQVLAVIGACAAYIGARTWRKATAAKAGLQDSDALKGKLAIAAGITDPAERAKALDAIAKGSQ